MSNIRLQGNPSGTGTLTIASPNTNSDFTLNLPASNGTIPVLASVTNNGVVFVNGSGQTTSGSALTFDGNRFAVSASGLTEFRIADTGSATDQKNWTWQYGTGIGAGVLRLRAGNDANTDGQNAYIINRTGINVDNHQWLANGSEQMRLTSTGLTVNGVNGYNVQVSGGNAYRMYATVNDLVFRSVTAGSDVMTLTYGGNVGIGTSSPKLNANGGTFLSVVNPSASGWLELGTSSQTDGFGGAVTFNNTNIAGDDKRIAQINGVRAGANNSGVLSFVTNNAGSLAERARFTSSGVFDIGTGAGAVGQIQFPATQVASANANTLDDYEEGTWTGGFGDRDAGGTWTSVSGTYTKVGRSVLVTANITGTSMNFSAATRYAIITGLPFSSAPTCTGAFITGQIAGTGLNGVLYVAGTQAILYGANTTSSVNDLTFSAVYSV